MSKAVKSDGVIQQYAENFLAEFDISSDERIDNALNWFSGLKENKRHRLDDVKLLTLVQISAKFAAKDDSIPPILKKYMYIKLLQGKSSWEKLCDGGDGAKTDIKEDAAPTPMPWDGN